MISKIFIDFCKCRTHRMNDKYNTYYVMSIRKADMIYILYDLATGSHIYRLILSVIDSF